MKKSKRWIALASAAALTGLLVVGGAVAANGDRNDPLVTMSYLDKTVIPEVVSRVEEKMVPKQKELKDSFDKQIDAYKKELRPPACSSFL